MNKNTNPEMSMDELYASINKSMETMDVHVAKINDLYQQIQIKANSLFPKQHIAKEELNSGLSNKIDKPNIMGDHEVVNVVEQVSILLPSLTTLMVNICMHNPDTYIKNGDVGVDAADIIKAYQAILTLNSALKNIQQGDTTTEEQNQGIRVSSTPLHIWEKS